MVFKAVMPVLIFPRLALEDPPARRLGFQTNDNSLVENLQRLDGFSFKPEPDAVVVFVVVIIIIGKKNNKEKVSIQSRISQRN